MEFTDHAAIRSHLANYNSFIILGYAAFAVIAIAALYLASNGPGFTEAELAISTVLP
jgi:hypothetical protein